MIEECDPSFQYCIVADGALRASQTTYKSENIVTSVGTAVAPYTNRETLLNGV